MKSEKHCKRKYINLLYIINSNAIKLIFAEKTIMAISTNRNILYWYKQMTFSANELFVPF